MSYYNEPEALRHSNAAARVYTCVLHLLEPWFESSLRRRQHAAQSALETAGRQLVQRRPERFVDAATGELRHEAIRRYVLKTVAFKARATWRYDGDDLDAEGGEDDRSLSETVAGDPFDTLSQGATDGDPVVDAIVRWHADLDDLRDLAAEQRRDAAEAELPGQIVREWVDARPDVFTNPEVAETLALRAEGYDFMAIAKRLEPGGDPASLRKASARARKHVERGRRKLPAAIAALLPAANRHGRPSGS